MEKIVTQDDLTHAVIQFQLFFKTGNTDANRRGLASAFIALGGDPNVLPDDLRLWAFDRGLITTPFGLFGGKLDGDKMAKFNQDFENRRTA